MRWVGSTFLLSSLAAFCLVGCSSSNGVGSHADSSAGGASSVMSAAGSGAGGASGSGSVMSAAGSGVGGASGSGRGSGGVASQADSGRSGAGQSGAAAGGSAGGGPTVVPVALPNGDPGIGFDDLEYAPVLKKLLVPAGRTGELDLVDPVTLEVTVISGFSTTTMFTLGKHRSGSTSADADEAGGRIFAVDNETKTVRVVDLATKTITFSTPLAAPPDYVRWIASTGEIWVTGPNNPGVTQSANPGIEVLTAPAGAAPVHAAMIPISNGPEALSIDNVRHRVYTNSFRGQTYAVDIAQRAVVETWQNGCTGLTVDVELDETRGFAMAVCATPGRVAVLDVANGGKQLGELSTGSGLDVCAYSASLHHLYLAGQTSADLSIVGISAAGVPTLLGKVPTTTGSQMVAADDLGNAWVGDPAGARLLKVRDTYPATP